MIQFLGTGGIGCKTRNNTSVLIDESILLDIGSGVVNQIKKLSIDIKKINYLLISHYHTDHFSDISTFISERIYDGKASEPLTIIGPKDIKQKVVDFLNIMDGYNEEWNCDNIERTYHIKFYGMENESYFFPTLKITAENLKHGDTKSMNGYILQFKDFSIGYSSDTTICLGLEKIVSCSDLMIIDAAYLKTTDWHLGLNDVVKMALKNSSKNFYAIHRKDYLHETKISNLFFPEDGNIIELL